MQKPRIADNICNKLCLHIDPQLLSLVTHNLAAHVTINTSMNQRCKYLQPISASDTQAMG